MIRITLPGPCIIFLRLRSCILFCFDFCCHILWILTIGILLWHPVNLGPWTSFCSKILLILDFQSLFCHEVFGILDPKFLVHLGILKILKLDFFVPGYSGSWILNFCFGVGSWVSWILTKRLCHEILLILDLEILFCRRILWILDPEFLLRHMSAVRCEMARNAVMRQALGYQRLVMGFVSRENAPSDF